MTELSDLCKKISSADLPDGQIATALRAHGFRASVSGLRKILSLSVKLRPQFEQLQAIFPESKCILEDFLRSTDILNAITLLEDERLSLRVDDLIRSEREAFGLSPSFAGKQFKIHDIEEFPCVAECAAFIWVALAAVQALPGLEITQNLAKFLKACVEYFQSSRPAEAAQAQDDSTERIAYCDDIDQWSALALPTFREMSFGALEDHEIQSAIDQSIQLLRKVESNFVIQSGAAIKSAVTNQRGANLSERELLNVHHNAFSTTELDSISKELCDIVNAGSNEYAWKSTDLRPAYFYEVLIISLALATGRTISGALRLRVIRGKENEFFASGPDVPAEYIFFKLVQGFSGRFFYSPTWIRRLSTNYQYEIPLPAVLNCLKSEAVFYNSAVEFLDCLPYTLAPWEDRCHAWLATRLQGSKRNIDRRIRDALARTMYHDTANPALITWMATPLKDLARKSESLSSYLDPSGSRCIKSYQDACKQIFNKELGKIYKIPSDDVIERWPFEIDEAQSIPKVFLDNVRQAEKSRNPYIYHNVVSTYLLMLLIVATGHRKSLTPFYFSWDFLIEECLVFISDKLTVGSEARLVPLPKWIIDQIVAYREHLFRLYRKVKHDHPALASALRQILPGIEPGNSEYSSQGNDIAVESRSPIGFFFTLDEGLVPRTISTRHLEAAYAERSKKGIRNFRKCIANSLWSQGLSGLQIEGFLGHNGDMHVFGESSNWSIVEWAKPIRDAQTKHLAKHGWIPIEISSIGRSHLDDYHPLPELHKSNAGYEGRELSSSSARARARNVIRDLLPAEWFDSDSAQITDSDVQSLKDAAQDLLATDQTARDKISQMLAIEVQRIRRRHGRRISSRITNMTRTEAGPIDPSFSRHFAISSCVRDWWIDRMGNYSIDRESNYLERAAEIGINLVVFDAVLDRRTWESLLTSIVAHQTRTISGCVIVRAEVERQSRLYDKVLIANPITAAAIVGFERLYEKTKPMEHFIREVTNRVNGLLKAAPHRGASLKFETLICVFQAWWLPRLPGVLHAIAVGNYSGPAPDQQSDCALYGKHCSDLKTPPTNEDYKILLEMPKGEFKYANRLINKLLNSAKGKFELMVQTSKSQRRLLAGLLLDDLKHIELKHLANQVPIVSVMLGFLQYMIVEGGKHQENLRFISIVTYYSRIQMLIDYLWNEDFSDLRGDEYDAAYEKIVKSDSQAGGVIWLFHKYMRITYDAPYSQIAMNYKRAPTGCRSTLVTCDEFEKAWDQIGPISDDGQLVRHTKSFMSIAKQYGFRTRETLGLSRRHFLSTSPFSVLVERNKVRDLKTRGKASHRVATPLLSENRYQNHLKSVVNMSRHAQAPDELIFIDTGKKNQLYPVNRITLAATLALRTATGNLSVVPYSMRHTVATRLCHFYIRSNRRIPLSKSVDDQLIGKLKEDGMTACFKQGFMAWPFWVDRVGMFLGHSSVDTLLNTYYHSSHVRLAEHTWNASEDLSDLKPRILASLLGMDRSVISRRSRELTNNNDGGISSSFEAMVSYYVDKSIIPTIDSDFDTNSLFRELADHVEEHVDSNNLNAWPAYDRILCARLAHGLSIDEMISKGNHIGLPKRQLSSFVDAYKSIIVETRFTDFEPTNSELLHRLPKRQAGVKVGSRERERGLTSAQRLHIKSPDFAEKFRQFCVMWIERVSASSPWFVAHDSREVSLILDILLGLGVDRSQLEFRSCNFNLTSLAKILPKSELASVESARGGLSRDGELFRKSEFGIRVAQMAGSTIGDNRDTHRLVLVAAALAVNVT